MTGEGECYWHGNYRWDAEWCIRSLFDRRSERGWLRDWVWTVARENIWTIIRQFTVYLQPKERVSLSIRKRRVDIYLAMEIQPYSRAAYQGQLGESVREENYYMLMFTLPIIQILTVAVRGYAGNLEIPNRLIWHVISEYGKTSLHAVMFIFVLLIDIIFIQRINHSTRTHKSAQYMKDTFSCSLASFSLAPVSVS